MNHSEIRELAALQLYGELDPSESERLAAHLAGCAECRAFAAELGRGLGLLARSARESEAPAGWQAALRRRLARRSTVLAGLGPGIGIAAGFVLGVLCTWALALLRTPASPVDEPGSDARLVAAFARPTPPPPARVPSSIARLHELRR